MSVEPGLVGGLSQAGARRPRKAEGQRAAGAAVVASVLVGEKREFRQPGVRGQPGGSGLRDSRRRFWPRGRVGRRSSPSRLSGPVPPPLAAS